MIKRNFFKKKYLIIIIPLVAIGLYLWLAYAYIYFRIGKTALPASDTKYSYVLNTSAKTEKSLVYVALGDSLTAGVGVNNYQQSYPYLLAEKLSFNYDNFIFKDFSYPGAKTNDLINNLLTPAITSQPDIVTLLIGINDIHGRISPEVFAKNYRFILEQLQTKTKAKIYVISLPFLGAKTLLLPPYNYYFHQQTINYNKIIQNLAKTYNLSFIDLASLTAEGSKNSAYYAADLFHPTAQSYKLWATIIYDHLH
jgi:lysophospholipase L1-like esterase